MFKFILGLIIGLLCVVFFFQNNEVVNVNFLAWTLTLQRNILFSVVFLAGIFLGWIFTSFSFLRRRKKK